MWRVSATRGVVRRINRLQASSVWYGPDGTLAYAWAGNAFFRRGEEVKRLLPHTDFDANIRGLRFRRDGPGLLVLKKDELLAWDPDRGTLDRIARAPRAVDAALFRGRIPMLLSRPDPH